MSTLITSEFGNTSPHLVLGYETERTAQNIVHDLVGGGVGITLVRPRPRSGTLELFYLTEADAAAAVEIHSVDQTLTLSSEDLDIDMTYVVSGSISIRLDEGTRRRWTVSVGYQEVTV